MSGFSAFVARDSAHHARGPAGSDVGLVAAIQDHAISSPDALAFRFLDDGEGIGETLSYGELHASASSIASKLTEETGPGGSVLLLFPPGLDFVKGFLGCLYAGVTAVPLSPPLTQAAAERLSPVILDSGAKVALATAGDATGWPLPSDVRVISPEGSGEAPRRTAEPGEVALLQYTSGSTAAPRGVRVTHGNLARNQELIRRAFATSPRSVVVSWLPPYHDMGLIGAILHPLYLGASCVLMSPLSFLERPARWLEAISRFGGTTSGGPNFAFDLCVRRISSSERAGLDLRTWTTAFNGAEPIQAATLARFEQSFAPHGFDAGAFQPCYGLAESTLLVSAAEPGTRATIREVCAGQLECDGLVAAPTDRGTRTLVGCGRPAVDRLVVVDRRGVVLPEDRVGQIVVTDECVAAGYHGAAAKSWPAGPAATLGEASGRVVATGDQGFLHDGELFITGRLKDMVIVRGRNHAPHDIELSATASSAAFRPGGCAAFSVDRGSGEELVVLQEVRRDSSVEPALARELRERVVTEHGIAPSIVGLLPAGTIPKTSSGKVRRLDARAAFLGREFEVLLLDDVGAPGARGGPETETAAAGVLGHVARVLGVSERDLDLDVPPTALGLDSISAIDLHHALIREFGPVITVAELLADTPLADLCERLGSPRSAVAQPPPLRDDTRQPPDRYQAAPAQEALWFLDRLGGETPLYTIGRALRLRGALDPDRLRVTFQTLVARHPALRTVYRSTREGLVAQVTDGPRESFQLLDASDWSDDETAARIEAEARRPLDLETGPVVRGVLFRRSADDHVLVFTVHHAAADLWALGILFEELEALYSGTPPESLVQPEVVPSDHARWQRAVLEGPDGAALAEHWDRELKHCPLDLRLTPDPPSGGPRDYRAGTVRFSFDEATSARLIEMSARMSVTPASLMLTAFAVLLHRYSGHHELLIGCPSAARQRPELARLVGSLTNLVAIRTDASHNPAFSEFARAVHATMLRAISTDVEPFAAVVRRVAPGRDPSQPPLVNALFTFQQGRGPATELLTALALGASGVTARFHDLLVEVVPLDEPATSVDLDVAAGMVAGRLHGVIKHTPNVFDASRAALVPGHLLTILRAGLDAPETRVSELPLLEPRERAAAVLRGGPRGDYQRDVRLHEMFAQWARETPDKPALIDGSEIATFGGIDEEAERLAAVLMEVRRG